jgi:C-5 cytosine-specific DNA methylase.
MWGRSIRHGNVPQLIGSNEHSEILELAGKMGCKVVSSKLCAANFGISQVRYRAFLVGCKFAGPSLVFPPQKTHFNPRNGNPRDSGGYIAKPIPWRTLKDEIADCLRPKSPG